MKQVDMQQFRGGGGRRLWWIGMWNEGLLKSYPPFPSATAFLTSWRTHTHTCLHTHISTANLNSIGPCPGPNPRLITTLHHRALRTVLRPLNMLQAYTVHAAACRITCVELRVTTLCTLTTQCC